MDVPTQRLMLREAEKYVGGEATELVHQDPLSIQHLTSTSTGT